MTCRGSTYLLGMNDLQGIRHAIHAIHTLPRPASALARCSPGECLTGPRHETEKGTSNASLFEDWKSFEAASTPAMASNLISFLAIFSPEKPGGSIESVPGPD